MIGHSDPGRGKRCTSPQKSPDQLCFPPSLSCLLGIGGFFLLRHKADFSTLCSAEVKNEWSYMCTSALPVCLHDMYREKLGLFIL
jgi:hypothetical protein